MVIGKQATFYILIFSYRTFREEFNWNNVNKYNYFMNLNLVFTHYLPGKGACNSLVNVSFF